MADLTFGNLGDCEPGDFRKEPRAKAAVSITGGQVLVRDNTVTPNVLKVGSAADVGPFFVADFNGAASGDLTVSAYSTGKVLVQASGAIQPYQNVVADNTGKVKAATNETADKMVGQYIGHMGEGTGTVVPTAAANTDKIWIQLGVK